MKNSDLTNKTILLVNTGTIKKRFILFKLKKLGLKIVCLNSEKNWAQPYVDHWIIADNTNRREAVLAVKEFITGHPDVTIDGVLTFWEDDVLLASLICDRFNFIGIPFRVAKKVRNKYLFREFCREHGIPAPNHQIIKSANDITSLPEHFRFPLVIKPIFGASSAYVVKVENKDELLTTYEYIKNNISATSETALVEGVDVFVEEYIDGDEVDIDIVLQNGKIKFYSIADNSQTREPFFVETGQAIPSSLPMKNQRELIDLAEETLEKLGVQNGVIHFEAKSTKNGSVPIEINLRMGGDEVYSFVRGAWNFDLIESAVYVAIGDYITHTERPEVPRKHITGTYFLSEYSGVLSQVDINEDLKKKEYLEEVHFFKKVGDPILVPPEGYEYLGWITVSGYSLPDAQENLKDALRYVKYEVAKFTSESSIGKTLRRNSFSHASLNTNIVVQAARLEKIRQVSRENLKKLHIGIAGNIFKDSDDPFEKKLTLLGKSIEQTLKEQDYHVTFFNFNDPLKIIRDTKFRDVDFVINLCQKINNSNQLEPSAAAVFELMQLPFTGSNSLTLGLCMDKIKVKKLLAYHGIPTPTWDYAYALDDEISSQLKYPLIVKPSNTNHSVGITNESIVQNAEQLRTQMKMIIEELKSPVVVEEYIEGDEYEVSILGNADDDVRVLPLSRSIFKEMPEGRWHIYTHDAKFHNDSPARTGITIQRPAKNIPKKLETLITEIALDAYNILDCQDYATVEIRVDQFDNPYVLEVNPNPMIDSTDTLPEVAKLTQLSYDNFLEELIVLAVRRYAQQSTILNISS